MQNNSVIVNIRTTAISHVPTELRNITVGAPTQPGDIWVYGVDGSVTTASGIVQGAGIAVNSVDTTKIISLAVEKLLAGTLEVSVSVGTGNVKIDGANKQILVNDGSNDRILIGYQSGGF